MVPRRPKRSKPLSRKAFRTCRIICARYDQDQGLRACLPSGATASSTYGSRRFENSIRIILVFFASSGPLFASGVGKDRCRSRSAGVLFGANCCEASSPGDPAKRVSNISRRAHDGSHALGQRKKRLTSGREAGVCRAIFLKRGRLSLGRDPSRRVRGGGLRAPLGLSGRHCGRPSCLPRKRGGSRAS